MDGRLRKILGPVAAAAITAALMYLISRRVDLRAAVRLWRDVQPLPIAGAVAVLFVEAFIVECYKWHLLLKWKGMPIPYLRLLRVKVSAALFHAGLPFKLGAVTEGVYIHRIYGYPLDHTLSTIGFDLLLNFIGLLVLATLGIMTVGVGGEGLLGFPVWFWTLVGAGGIAVLVVPLVPPGLALLGAVARVLPGRVGRFADGLLEGFRGLGLRRKVALLGLAVGMQSLNFLIFLFVMRAFELDVPVWYMAVTVPVVFFIGAIPVTISGFGTREWLVILFFTKHRAFMTPEQAVGATMFAGLVVVLFNCAVSLPFLPSYLRGMAEGSHRQG